MAADERFHKDVDGQMRDHQFGAHTEPVTDPVSDWATDFSHLDPAWAADPYAIQDDLRGRCPIAHSERFGGVWVPTRYDDIAAIAYDSDHFSSRTVVVSTVRPSLEVAPVGVHPPITSDPPFHHDARKLLLPAFTKAAIAKLEPATRAFCHALIDTFDGRTEIDAAADYAQHIPIPVIANMLGFPPEDGAEFREFVENAVEGVNLPPDERMARKSELFDYLVRQIHDHVKNPRDDLTTYLINAELGGRKLDASHIAGTMGLLLIAGVDTTWSAIGASLWHLAKTPADRERLVAEPQLLPVAIEEFLRAYAPVTMARLVREDIEWKGIAMKAEDFVLLPFPAANRDPEHFERPDEIVIDRQVNRHAAFGLGIHRCLGSHLARMELRVAVEVWLERIPSFSLIDPDVVTWAAGQTRGPRNVPVRTAGPEYRRT